MTDDSRIVTLADIQAAFEQYSEGKATPERIWNALPVPSPSGDVCQFEYVGTGFCGLRHADHFSHHLGHKFKESPPSGDVDAACLKGADGYCLTHDDPRPGREGGARFIQCEAAIRAQSSIEKVLRIHYELGMRCHEDGFDWPCQTVRALR